MTTLQTRRQIFDLCRAAIELGPVPDVSDESLGEVARLAVEHGLGPLVCQGLQRGRPQAQIPDSLKRARERSISYELEQSLSLNEVITGFAEALARRNMQYPCLVLKGMHLRQTVYGQAPYLRPMNDLDLLVHDADLEPARALLSRLGYQRLAGPGPGFHQRLAHAETWVRTVRPGFISMVDLHRRLIHRMRGTAPVPFLFAQAQELEPGMWGLSNPHLAAHLAVHLAHEFFRGRLRGLVDLDLHLLRHPEVDFESQMTDPVIRMARNAVYLCHVLSERMAEINWTPPAPAPGCGWMLNQLFQDERIFDGRKGGLQSPENLLRAMVLMDSPALRIGYPGYVTAAQLGGLFSRRSIMGNQAVYGSPAD